MAAFLTPIVRWAENGAKINLSVELSDVKNPKVVIDEHSLTFKGFGRGAQGEKLYNFTLDFFRKIDYKNSTYKCNDRSVSFVIWKQVKTEEWSRLLKQERKPGWLRVDFDKLVIEESADEKDSMEDEINKITFEQRMKSEIDKAKSDIVIYAKVAWLTIYNIFQAVCFTIMFFKIAINIVKNGKDAHLTVYDDISELLLTCQLGAFVEILHPLLGVVKTGFVAPLLQVGARNFVLFVLVVPEKEIQTHPIFLVLVFAWCLSEVIRYPFYVTSLHRYYNILLSWLRYSAWVVLYPAGMLSEVVIMCLSIELSHHRWQYNLPNPLNFSFSLPNLLCFLLVIYFPFAAYLLKHMWILRCRKLGGRKLKEKRL